MEFIYKNKKGERIILNFSIGKAPSEVVIKRAKYVRDFEAELSGKSFCLKGGGWPSQDSRKKAQRTASNKAAGKRTKDSWGDPVKLIPNYKGIECESWTEVSEISKKDKEKE